MKIPAVKPLLMMLLLLALAGSFWYSAPWLKLCYGLALFLFGMQCIEEGLHNAASGTLERLMAKSTATPVRGMLFGMGATFVLQSSTLVSLLTMAFLSTGLIALAGGIAVLLGTNLGATSGIWLLAMAGQSISLSPAAIPMLVFGILGGFFGGKYKAFGRVLVGIALIFLGIDAIKDGFQAVGSFDLNAVKLGGMAEIALFCLLGLLLTVVLQSSHATLILTLAALAGGQIGVLPAFAIAIGSNVGSSASTALVGMLGSERDGQRLALAHLLFNVVTAVLSLLLWWPLTKLVTGLGTWLNMSALLQLALFHSLFNLLGLAVFWPWQQPFAALLRRWLPDKSRENLLAADSKPVRPRYLNDNMLRSGDTAVQAVLKEIRHLGSVSLEVISRVLYIPTTELYALEPADDPELPAAPLTLDAQNLYDRQIKPLYSALLDFTSKIDISDTQQQQWMTSAHMAALQMVEAVKDSKHLQKNLQQYLQQPETPLQRPYLRLRRHLFKTLRLFRYTAEQPVRSTQWQSGMEQLQQHIDSLEVFRGLVMVQLRNGELDGWQTSSLMNDSNYARRIGLGLLEILQAAEQGAVPPGVVAGV